MIERLASHAGLPVWIARRVRHDARAPIEADGHVLSRGRRQAVVTGDAAIGGLKLRDGRRTGASTRTDDRRQREKSAEGALPHAFTILPTGRRRTSPRARTA